MTNGQTKHLFIDTNIALHYVRVDKVVWRDVTNHSSNVIIIAPVVLRELDEKKFSAKTRKLQKRANDRVKWLWSISDNSELAIIRQDTTLHLLTEEPTIEFSRYNLKDNIADDYLLASILGYQEKNNTAAAIVTSDIGLKIKARNLGIEVIPLPDNFRLSLEPDETEKELLALKKELAEHKNRRPSLALYGAEVDIFAPGESINFPADNAVTLKPPYIVPENEFIHRCMEDEKKKRFYLKGADKYNQQLDNYFKEFEEYLREDYMATVNTGFCYSIAIQICNNGTKLADNVDAEISFPDHIGVSKEWISAPELAKPKPPDRPSPASVLDAVRELGNSISQFNNPYANMAPYIPPFPNPHKSGPRVKNDHKIGYWCDEIKHGFCTKFDNYYIVVPYNQELTGFIATCSLSCNELPKAQEQFLNFSFSDGQLDRRSEAS